MKWVHSILYVLTAHSYINFQKYIIFKMFIFFLSFLFLLSPLFFQKSYLSINIVNISVRVIKTRILWLYINNNGTVKRTWSSTFFSGQSCVKFLKSYIRDVSPILYNWQLHKLKKLDPPAQCSVPHQNV
jgi:hypothetical protein